jgi:hypothetical protein
VQLRMFCVFLLNKFLIVLRALPNLQIDYGRIEIVRSSDTEVSKLPNKIHFRAENNV